jgi:hypothetical protein
MVMNDDALQKVLELLNEIKKSFNVCCALQMQWSDSAKEIRCECHLIIPSVGLILCDDLEWILKKADDIRECIKYSEALTQAATNLNTSVSKLTG